MTKDETKKILAIVIASYPNYKPENMQVAVNVWNKMLEEYEYKDVETGLMAYIKTDKSGFAPSIGQLIDCIVVTTKEPDMNELEAWSLVRNAIADSTYHSQDRFDELPQLVKDTLVDASQLRIWAMDMAFNESVAQSNFMRSYKQVVERKKNGFILNAINTQLLKQSKKVELIEGGKNE